MKEEMDLQHNQTQRRRFCLFFVVAVMLLEIVFQLSQDETVGSSSNSILSSLSSSSSSSSSSSLLQEEHGSYDKFGFYLMGDTPYRRWEAKLLGKQLETMNQLNHSHIQFTVHVGDFQKPIDKGGACLEEKYIQMASTLRKGDLPTLLVPGDNDWYKCNDRKAGLGYWRKHLTDLEQDMPLLREEGYPELFSFLRNGILFLSVHLINGKKEVESPEQWDARMQKNEQWVGDQIETYFAQSSSSSSSSSTPIRAVILLGHSLRSPRTRPFFEYLATHFVNDDARKDIPVVYLHGDGHDWDVDRKFSHQLEWKNYYDIQVDQGAFADPLIVEFAPQVRGKPIPMRQNHDKQLVIADGLIRIDRQTGKYSDQFLDQFAKQNGGRVVRDHD